MCAKDPKRTLTTRLQFLSDCVLMRMLSVR
jgi:hypothetical protein